MSNSENPPSKRFEIGSPEYWEALKDYRPGDPAYWRMIERLKGSPEERFIKRLLFREHYLLGVLEAALQGDTAEATRIVKEINPRKELEEKWPFLAEK